MIGFDTQYDMAIAWTWQYDFEFVRLIQDAAQKASLRILAVDAKSIAEVLDRVRKRLMYFGVFLDRASDEDETFLPLVRLIQRRQHDHDPALNPVYIINPPDLLERASDKATMHLEFLSMNINVPYTIIISPYNHRKEIELTVSELALLRRPFIIKPANTTGGGIGVVTGAETLKDVLEARQHHRNDKYLLQETIKPLSLGVRRAWFRVFYVFGMILICWWDDGTHIYETMSEQDEELFGLGELRRMTEKVHSVCNLDFFSTEFAMTIEQRLVAVDYVNEMCDMRLQSKHLDGVPDQVVRQIVDRIIWFAKEKR